MLTICLLAGATAAPRREHSASQISGPASEVLFGDLDGDGLKDLILVNDLKLSIFYQSPASGFTRAPQQTHRLEHRPCIVWTARLGKASASLLLMTSDGVTELVFTNRAGPPEARQIIKQPTIVPAACEETNVLCLSLSVETGSGWPLLLLPAADGLQVWSTLRSATEDGSTLRSATNGSSLRSVTKDGATLDGQQRGPWHQAQVIGGILDARLRPSLANPGYTTSVGLNLSVSDINGDGRDDLLTRRSDLGQTNTYTLYLQQTNGLFAVEPALKYADPVEPNSWLGWFDFNHDGKVDLIKSTWLNEPSFVPGHSSGKVLLRTYQADARGRLPAEPQQVFRKNDWTAAVPAVDIDGDGLLDLALGFSPLDTREGVRKEITAKQLDFNLKFYFYRAGTGFPKEADCQRDVVIRLDQAALLLSWERRLYFERYVQLTGDFNGDGKTDLLVRDHSNDLSVYFFASRQNGFNPRPDLKFRCPELVEDWQVEDLNNDGVSDLIVKLAKQDAFRIFISQP